jgi:hypothetical protein
MVPPGRIVLLELAVLAAPSIIEVVVDIATVGFRLASDAAPRSRHRLPPRLWDFLAAVLAMGEAFVLAQITAGAGDRVFDARVDLVLHGSVASPANRHRLARSWAVDLRIAAFVDESQYSAVAGIIAQSDEALDRVLGNLERRTVLRRPAQLKLAFEALASRLRQEPLPPKAWAERVVAICQKYPSEGAPLYWQITGQQLDRA